MSDGNDKRFAQFPIEKAAWSSEKEKELLSLQKQNKSLQESMVTLLEAKLEKENENGKLITKVEQLERNFLKKAKEVDSLKDEKVTKEKKLDTLPSRDKSNIAVLNANIDSLEKEVINLRRDLGGFQNENALLKQLIKQMGDKLSENNAGIADLSDPNRSTKLAEKYNTLYDNDWTDALESLTTEGRVDEEAGYRFLLEIMKHASSFCKRAYMKALQSLECILSNPVSSNGQPTDISARSGEDKQISQMLETCVKLKTKTAILNLQKSYMASSRKPLYAERLPEYVNKCIEICWLMNTHNPPLEFAEPPMCGQPYDKNSYKEFTKQGDTVSFVVWLPLLIEKDGPVLTKGVVQPIAKSFSSSVSEKKRNTSADKTKVRVRPEKDNERLQRLLYNKEVEQKDSYEHYQSKDAENKFSDLIGKGRQQQYTTDYNTKYGEYIDRPVVDKNEHHLNEMFQDSTHRPYSANVRSPTNTESEYKYSTSSEPATKKFSSYGQSEHYKRPHSAITQRHTEYDYKHERPKTAAVESKGRTPTYFDPKSAEIYQDGRKKYALYQNQLYEHDRVSNAWQLSSGFDT